MGKYINKNSAGDRLPAQHKAAKLIEDGAELLFETPKVWEDNLVCVVSNGDFDAAAYAYSERELQEFADPKDPRPKVWLRYKHASILANT